MKNIAFSQMTAAERREKLEAAIRYKTDGLLSAEELDTAMQAADLCHQYGVIVYRNYAEMVFILMRLSCKLSAVQFRYLIGTEAAELSGLEKQIYASTSNNEIVMAVVTKDISASGILFIYIPPTRERKESAIS